MTSVEKVWVLKMEFNYHRLSIVSKAEQGWCGLLATPMHIYRACTTKPHFVEANHVSIIPH